MRRLHLFAAPLLLAACSLILTSHVAFAQFERYGAPTLSCVNASQTAIQLEICGDATTGAPAGVSVHWKKCSDYAAALATYGDGWTDMDGKLCELSLSGMPGRDHGGANSRWDLGPGLCQTIQIGDNLFDETGASGNCVETLECGECYVFRVFAHADRNAKRSVWSANLECATAACDNGQCTRTQGYWKNHGPGTCAQGQNQNEWNLTSLMLGTVNYTDTQLCNIMKINPPNCGSGNGADALLKLAHQLIAAKLNEAEGTDISCVAATISQANALIGGLIVAPTAGNTCVGENTLLGGQMNALATTLDQYNNGFLSCAHHCQSATGAVDVSPAGATEVKSSSWGSIKVIYR